ncbi:gremlin-2 [Trichomycterus rosablanca]|uniref:gremlin-2 n=1 Tax=Trichomycterus rosablanca TaxID=2290929 RepID=UPI002F351789
MFWKLVLPALLSWTLCASSETKKLRPRGSIPPLYKHNDNRLSASPSFTLASPPHRPVKHHKGEQEGLLSSREALVVTERRYLKSDWCKTQPLKQTLSLDGCVSRTIVNRFCYGQCNSFYIPRHQASWDRPRGRERSAKPERDTSFQSCSFCKPQQISTITVRLLCPRLQPPYRYRKVQRIKECRCMSISVQ